VFLVGSAMTMPTGDGPGGMVPPAGGTSAPRSPPPIARSRAARWSVATATARPISPRVAIQTAVQMKLGDAADGASYTSSVQVADVHRDELDRSLIARIATNSVCPTHARPNRIRKWVRVFQYSVSLLERLNLASSECDHRRECGTIENDRFPITAFAEIARCTAWAIVAA
jgi:hypothetical protein